MDTERKELERLYRDSFPGVARMIRTLGGDLESARDLFHDAMLIYLEKQATGKLELKTTAGAYLAGIARHLWLKEQRKSIPVALLPDDAELSDDEDLKTAPGSDGNLLRQLEAVGRKCLQLLQAFYYDQLSMEELAARFGYSSSRSATVQKYKCLEKMRGEVKKRDYHEAGA